MTYLQENEVNLLLNKLLLRPHIFHLLTGVYLYLLQDGNDENKLRLMMIYALADPENFQGDKATALMEVAT